MKLRSNLVFPNATAQSTAWPPPIVDEVYATATVNATDAHGTLHYCHTDLLEVNMQVALPPCSAVPKGWQVGFVFASTGGAAVDLNADGGDLIAVIPTGTNPLTLATYFQTVTLISDHVNKWIIIASYGL